MIKYGLISSLDAEVIEATLNYVCSDFPNGDINTCEVGVYSGESSRAIMQYLNNKGRKVNHIGVDNLKDGELLINFPKEANMLVGNSFEVYSKIPDESLHFCFVDADHSFIGVISDFFAFERKVMNGGYLCFHDTGKHIKPFKDFQHGDRDNPFAYISVRAALERIGLLGNRIAEWRLIFDEADESDDAGGVCVFKKVAKWD
jgi:hypothetical protein